MSQRKPSSVPFSESAPFEQRNTSFQLDMLGSPVRPAPSPQYPPPPMLSPTTYRMGTPLSSAALGATPAARAVDLGTSAADPNAAGRVSSESSEPAPAAHHHRLHDAVSRVVQMLHATDVHLSHNSFNAVNLDTESLDKVNDISQVAAPSVGGEQHDSMFLFLRTVPHLYMLPEEDLRRLGRCILRREYNPMDDIVLPGTKTTHVYVVLQGNVEVFAYGVNGDNERVGTVPTSNMFMFDSVIFDDDSIHRYRAGDKRTVLGLIPKGDFNDVLSRSLPMRQSIGRKLAEHMDIFICFKEFCRHVFSHESAQHEYLPIWTILESYQSLNNCIHAKMNEPELDTGAWRYAIGRLPENVTSTFCFDLARALPPFVAKRMQQLTFHTDENAPGAAEGGHGTTAKMLDIVYIKTKERRRCTWQLGVPGKSLVLLRDGFTDLLDFITCLCIHIIEASKLRARLQGLVHPPAIDMLDDALRDSEDCENASYEGATCSVRVENRILQRLKLSEEEQVGLKKIWPKDTIRRLWEVIMHREEYMLRVDASLSKRFQTDPFHEWALNLRSGVMKAIGLQPQSPLPYGLTIDIISSNTHSTKNLLSPFARRHRKDILAYGRASKPEISNLFWFNEEDLVYVLMPGFIQQNPQHVLSFAADLRDAGVIVMEDTAMTGLQVDIIPVSRLNAQEFDPVLVDLQCHSVNEHHFILNMDFAFGAQADGIMRTLITTFGHAIRSVNIMGKAGGLVGNRGDIQLATHVLLSKSSLTTEDVLDELRGVSDEAFTADLLGDLLGDRARVHTGPVLTIPGTMLQNVKLLKYYTRIWQCVGVEMEGSYFARQVRESQKAGLLRRDVKTRFAYYTSDLPLTVSSDATLSAPMQPNEGVPPLYAIARLILARCLTPDAAQS